MEKRFAKPKAVTLQVLIAAAMDITLNTWAHFVGVFGEKFQLHTKEGSDETTNASEVSHSERLLEAQKHFDGGVRGNGGKFEEHRGLHLEKVPNVMELGIYIEYNLVSELQPGSLNALPKNLKKLSLYYTYLSLEDMVIIGTLPNLEILKLIGYAFSGKDWNTRENEFCRLKYLQIEKSGLKDWSSAHFPILEYWNCTARVKENYETCAIPDRLLFGDSAPSLVLQVSHPEAVIPNNIASCIHVAEHAGVHHLLRRQMKQNGVTGSKYSRRTKDPLRIGCRRQTAPVDGLPEVAAALLPHRRSDTILELYSKSKRELWCVVLMENEFTE
nr:putative late blight resistance protein homolog R1B-16 [Ipomoea batatas]